MDSEVQRLRFRIRQLEREVRALRTSPLTAPTGQPGRARVARRGSSGRPDDHGDDVGLETPLASRGGGADRDVEPAGL